MNLRKRYRQLPDGSFVEIDRTVRRPVSAEVWDDLPGYQSPASGLWVEGRKARREDLKRTRCRPYEGREQEAKEAARYHAEQDRKTDALADKMARTAWAQAPERIRRVFRGK